MGPIDKPTVQAILDRFLNREVYLHLETTNGASSALNLRRKIVGAFIRNGRICFSRGVITGDGPFRVGLKLEFGWVYAEGLTDFVVDQDDRLLLAGQDYQGRLAVALELSSTRFA